MAYLRFAKIVIALYLTSFCSVNQSPLIGGAKLSNHGNSEATAQNLFSFGSPSSHVVKRSTVKIETTHNVNQTALQQTGDLLRLAALVPAETLQLLRMVAVPLLNSSLAMPANLLEEASKLSLADLNPGNWTGNTTAWINASLPSHRLHTFNLTSLEMQANSTVHNRILTPVGSFLSFSANKTRNALPTALDSDHLRRHFANLKSYLMARQTVPVPSITKRVNLNHVLPHKNVAIQTTKIVAPGRVVIGQSVLPLKTPAGAVLVTPAPVKSVIVESPAPLIVNAPIGANATGPSTNLPIEP